MEGRTGEYPLYDMDEEPTALIDGTTYTGDLSASDLDSEDIGVALIELVDVGEDEVRLVYTNETGSGTMRARMVMKARSGVGPEPFHRSLVDTTDLAAATHYYPRTTGAALGDYSDLTLSGKFIDADGTVTMTIEATNDEDRTSGDWIDVTPTGLDAKDNTDGKASVTVTNGTVTFGWKFVDLGFRFYRVKLVTSGATNTVIIKEARR